MPRKKGYDRSEDTAERLAKIRKKLRSEALELNELDVEALKAKIIECQANLVENQREMATDTDLKDAKERLANEMAPYKEAKERLTRVAEYCTLRLEELGK